MKGEFVLGKLGEHMGFYTVFSHDADATTAACMIHLSVSTTCRGLFFEHGTPSFKCVCKHFHYDGKMSPSLVIIAHRADKMSAMACLKSAAAQDSRVPVPS